MKKVLLTLAAAFMLFACNSGPKTPVDELLDILDDTVSAFLSGKSESDIEKSVQERAEAIVSANEDYVLTAADKEKMVKKYTSLMDVAIKAAIKSGELPEEMAEFAKEQSKEVLDELKEKLEKAETLGDLDKLL